MKSTAIPVFFFLLLGTLGSLRGEDWPTYRHDARRSGATAEKIDAQKLELSWVHKAALAPRPAWAGPAKWDAYAGIRGLRSMRNYDPAFHVIVVDGSVYYGSSADHGVHRLDAKTGRERWVFFTDAPVRIAPSWYSKKLYFGSDDGYAYCIRERDGSLVWKRRPETSGRLILNNGNFIPFWPCRTGVLVDRGIAYFGNSLLPWKDSYICAVNASTGKPSSKGGFLKKYAGLTLEGALLASPSRLIAPQGRVAPLLFGRGDGARLGSLEGGGGCFVLLTDDSRVLHGPGNKTGWITGSDEKSRGKVATFKNGNEMIIVGDTAYMLSDTALAAMDRKNKKGKWRTAGKYSLTMILAGDTIFAGGVDEVAAFRAGDGKRIWTGSVEGGAYGLAVSDGALYVSTDQGRISCFRPGKGKVKLVREEKEALEVLDVPGFKSPGLVGRWLLQSGAVKGRKVFDLAGEHHAEIHGSPRLVKLGEHQGMNFEGQVSSLRIADDHKDAGIPVRELSAEAWVRVDQGAPWGAIIGAFQDNGSYEKGWILGYVGSRFSLAIQGTGGAGAMTYMTANADFRAGQWYHVAGTYDGAEMKLYVDGKVAASGKTQSGPIEYPPTAFYEMAAYHDDDEYFRLKGALNEVRVYNRVLSAAECAEHSRSKKLEGGGGGAPAAGAESLALEAGPFLRFSALDKAVVRWETAVSSRTALVFGPRDGEMKKIELKGRRKEHELELTGLARNRLYTYSILGGAGDKELSTREYECDNFFNLTLPPARPEANPYSREKGGNLAGDVAARILVETGVDRGICLVLGSGDGRLAWELAARSRLQVVGVDTSEKAVAEARAMAYKAGVYGVRLKYYKVDSLSKLPFTGHFANLVVSAGMIEKGRCEGSAAELFRILRPSGGVAYLGQPAETRPALTKTELASWLKRGKVKFEAIDRDGAWALVRRGPLEGAGSWTHQYGLADNSAFGGEKLSGAGGISDLDVQWIGRPGPRAQPDRNGRKPSPLSTNGRLFVQGLHRIIGLDSYNGSILWSWEIPSMMRFNMPRDCSNWCADDDSVFVAMGGRCWRIDAKTGALSRSYEVRPGDVKDWEYDWSYLAREGDKVIGSGVKKGSAYTSFWGGSGAGWYDAKSGPVTHKVCSENLFALYEKSGQLKWEYSKGVIVNPTITVSGGRVYFVENRNSGVKEASDRRVGSRSLWADQYLVALDSDSGKKIWEKPIDTADGDVVFYLASGGGKVVLVASGGRKYHTDVFDSVTGKALWKDSFSWGQDHHGGHMARPAIVGGEVYVRPRAYDLATGKVLKKSLPGGGCGTYAATSGAFIFRSGNVTMWNRSNGKVTSWSRLRPDCWLSTIPAGGMLLSPEGGGGCSCGSWLETSIGFIPVARK